MDIPAWISMWISTFVWVIEDRHQKIIDIYVDIRVFFGNPCMYRMLWILVPGEGIELSVRRLYFGQLLFSTF